MNYDAKEIKQFKEELKLAIKEFMKYTESEDYMGVILRGHLYIENELTQLIQKILIKPDKISLPYFSTKLDAAYALGAIDDEWYGAFKKMNKIRNKYAHDLGYEFVEEDFSDLISTLSKDAKYEYVKNLAREEILNDFRKAIDGNTYETTLKDRLRLLFSDFMIYIKQQNQTIDLVWKEICVTKEAEILGWRIEKSKALALDRTEDGITSDVNKP